MFLYLFAQVSCQASPEKLAEKNIYGLLMACIGAFMCIGF